MEQVNWKPVHNYEGFYEINENGDVRSLHPRNFHRIMSQRIDRADYWTVRLSKKGKDSTQYVHRLLGFAFIPNPEADKKDRINHKDSNKLNNALENLEWVTHAENMKHAYKAGAIKLNIGKNHHEARTIQCIATGEIFGTIKDAAEKAGLNYNTFRNSLNTNSNREYIKLSS